MPKLTLYHTAGCHLCEQAKALILTHLDHNNLAQGCLELADIAEDNALYERYGVLIPVLRIEATNQELHWPFGLDDLQRLL